jgi:hypothetical protein
VPISCADRIEGAFAIRGCGTQAVFQLFFGALWCEVLKLGRAEKETAADQSENGETMGLNWFVEIGSNRSNE